MRAVALRILIVSLASALFPQSARAQVGVSRVVLATILDARGRPLTALGEDDFVVRENGELREVLSARLADYPVVLLIDSGETAAADFDDVRRAAARFVARIGGDRAIAIGALGNASTMITTFEDDRATVNAAIASLKPGGPSAGRFLEGIAEAAAMIRATQAPFSAVVVISAIDSDTPSAAPLELVAPIVDSRSAVHVVAKAREAAGGAAGTLGDTLRLVSDRTRGQFTAIFSAASYASALDRLADRLSAEMMIEFIEPPGAVPGDDVKVGVRLPGAQVRGLGVSK